MSSTFLFLNFVSLSSFHPYFILIGWFQHFSSATHFVRYKTMPCEFCIFFFARCAPSSLSHPNSFCNVWLWPKHHTNATTKSARTFLFWIIGVFLVFVFILQKNDGKNVCWTKRLFSKNWFMLTIASTQHTVCFGFFFVSVCFFVLYVALLLLLLWCKNAPIFVHCVVVND